MEIFSEIKAKIQNLVAISFSFCGVSVGAHKVIKITDAVFQIVQSFQNITPICVVLYVTSPFGVDCMPLATADNHSL
jgi:hypothetical protein